ncbi:MAG: metalloregulator ArsR/SmtB family transcription factor [Chitinophagales bacterium]
MASKTAKELVITKESGGQIKVNYPLLKRAALTLRALNHPLRRQMVQLVEDKKKLTVTELYVKLRLEQSVASQHLAILRRAQIVKTQREGKFIWYTTNKKRIEEINKLINSLAQPE